MTTISNNYGYYYPTQYASNNPEVAKSYLTNTVQDPGASDSFAPSSEVCTDGKDDGKIGFFEGVGQFFKGAAKGLVNGVKGMFLDKNGKFSLKNTLKTAVTIGACFIPVAGPYIAAGLCAVGVAKGAIGMAKSAVNIAKANTDAEAKEAISSLGGSTLATGLSAAGLKGATGAIAKSAGFSSTGAMLKATRTTAGRANITAGVKNSFSNYYGNAWSTGGAKAVIKQGAKGTAENVVGTAKAIKQKATDTSNKITGKTGSGNAENIAKKLSTRGEKVSVEQIQDAINNKGGKLQVGDKTYNLSQAGDDISYALQKTKPSTVENASEFVKNQYNNGKAYAKKMAPKTYKRVSEFAKHPVDNVKAFAQKTAPKTYARTSEFFQKHTPESVTKAVDSAKSFDAKAYINGIEPAQTVDYNAFIAKAVQDIE